MIGRLVEVGRYRKAIPSFYDISAVLSKADHQPVPSLPNVHCRQTFCARQKINHVVRDAGKMSPDGNMHFRRCNCGCTTDNGVYCLSCTKFLSTVYFGKTGCRLVLCNKEGSIAETSVKTLLNSVDFTIFK